MHPTFEVPPLIVCDLDGTLPVIELNGAFVSDLASHAIAPANAAADIRGLADVIVESNLDDGVAEYLAAAAGWAVRDAN